MTNIVYSPIGYRNKNDITIRLSMNEDDTPFWGYKPSIGRKIKSGDIVCMFLC